MQKLVLSLVLVLLAIGVSLCLWLRAPESVPMIPLTPATPRSSSVLESAPVPQAGTVEDNASRSNAGRADGGTTTNDDRVATLEVLVLCSNGDRPAEPVRDRDIEVLVDPPGSTATTPHDHTTHRGRTDAQGVARFDFRAADRRHAHVSAGSAEATVELRAGEVVRTTLRLLVRMLVHGTVTDQAGNGIAGAELMLLPWLDGNNQPPRPRCVGRSGANGSFAITLVAGGRLGAQHDSFAASPMYVIPPAVDPTAPPAVHTLRLVLAAPHGTAAVLVLDANGKPVPGAELEFLTPGLPLAGAALPAPPQHLTTDGDGRTVTGPLRPGSIGFAARASGHASTRGAFEARSGEVAKLEIRLPASCAVHGIVTTADGTRVRGARVWSDTKESFDSRWTLTDDEGTFQLEGLAPGEHEITAREGAPPNVGAHARRVHTRLDLSPDRPTHWSAVLAPASTGATLAGKVIDTDGAALPGWRVAARAADKVGNTVTTGDGSFLVAMPAAGVLDLFVYAPGTPLGAFATAVYHRIDPESAPVRLVVDRRAGTGALTGQVQTIDRAPIAATVVCYHHERRERARYQAQDDGTLRLQPLPPGTLDLSFEHPGFAPVARKHVLVEAGSPAELGPIVMGSAASLHGRVQGPGGIAPDQLELVLQTKEIHITGEYRAGAYTFATVPPGQHTLRVQGTGIAAASFPVQLTAGVDRQQDIILQPGVPRRLVVHVPPPGSSLVTLAIQRAEEAHSWLATSAVRADPAGSAHGIAEFTAWMAPGIYEVIAWNAEGGEGQAQVWFVAGDDSPVTIELRHH